MRVHDEVRFNERGVMSAAMRRAKMAKMVVRSGV